MDLSIIILFSDNDYKCVSNLIRSIKRNISIKGTYEILVSDNRENFKNEPLNIDNDIAVICNNGNIGASEGRRAGLMSAKGKYIWFIDADDEVIKLDNFDFSGGYDCYQFCYSLADPTSSNSPKYLNPLSTLYPVNVISKYNLRTNNLSEIFSGYYNYVSGMVWDKFFKREILINAYDNLPHRYLSIMEDTILIIKFLQLAENIKFLLDKIILYHNEEKQPTLEKLKKLYTNFSDTLSVFRDNNIILGTHSDIDSKSAFNVEHSIYQHLFKPEKYLSNEDYREFRKYLLSQSYKYIMTIIVPFIDSHWKYIPRLLENLKSSISVPYEVILVSNCTDPIELGNLADDNIILLNNTGKNIGPYNARKEAVEKASGRWTWFVDADDLIYPLEDEDVDMLYTIKYDILNFYTEVRRGNEVSIIELPEDIIHKNSSGLKVLGYMITNKWINTDFLRDSVFSDLKNTEVNFNMGEDVVLLTAILKNLQNEKVGFLKKPYYIYNIDCGSSGSLKRDISWLKRYMNLLPQVKNAYSSFLTPLEMREYCNWMNLKNEFENDTDNVILEFFENKDSNVDVKNEYNEARELIINTGRSLKNEENSHIHYL